MARARTGTIEPYKRPRRLHEKGLVRRMAQGTPGDCYRYAWREALAHLEAGSPRPALRVVHGAYDWASDGKRVIKHRENGGHAWIERGGMAYDWQTLVKGGAPLPIAEHRTSRLLVVHARYTAKQLMQLTSEGHYGPYERGAK